MKKLLSTVLAGALAATTLVPVAPAIAQNRGDWCKQGNCERWDGDRDRQSFRDRDRNRDRDRYSSRHDRDWRWRDRDNRWRHRDRDRFDGRDAAGLVFGLAAGAIAGSLANSQYQGSYERCAASYRSFDPGTWTYLGYDGYRHRCPY